MSDPEFDLEGVFDEDYLYFYETVLTPERSDAETERIVSIGGLETGMRILDVPCGHGRLSNRLAARGFEVVGVDITKRFLEQARTDAADLGVAPTYVEGDMRELPDLGTFDAAINWFTSFGYFPDPDTKRTLSKVRAALRPGGVLLIETQNRDRILRGMLPFLVHERGDDLMIDKNRFDPTDGFMHSERIIVRDGRVRRAPFSVRMFSFTELRGWLLDAGFSSVEGLDPSGEPLTLDSLRLVVRARV